MITATPAAAIDNNKAVLDRCLRSILRNKVEEGVNTLIDDLRQIRQELDEDQWLEFVKTVAVNHPIKQYLYDDPFTYRGYIKPRGYPGDATLLDFIYGNVPLGLSVSDMGFKIYKQTSRSPGTQSIIARRDLLANLIDATAASRKRPNILAIAGGHLREASIAQSVRGHYVGSYFVLDSDQQALNRVVADHADKNIQTIRGSVKTLIAREQYFSNIDFVYTAGLYDYLDLPVAQKLTELMFSYLRRGGRLLVANFVPEIRETGYMEAFMDWRLIYRDEQEMQLLYSNIDPASIGAVKTFRDESRNSIFLEMTKSV